MSLGIVEKLVAKAETLDPMMQPITVEGERKHVLLMHTFRPSACSTSVSQNDWLDIQKAAASVGTATASTRTRSASMPTSSCTSTAT